MTCDECKAMRAKNNAEHSSEWNITKVLAKENQRQFIIIIAVIILWLLTVGFALWQTIRFEEYKSNVSEGYICEMCFTEAQSITALSGGQMNLMLPKRKSVYRKRRMV